MIIRFKNGYFIESNDSGYHLKFDTGKVKKVERAGFENKIEIPVVKRIGSSTNIEGIANLTADIKIKRIESDKVSVILAEMNKIKQEIVNVLNDNGFNSRITAVEKK